MKINKKMLWTLLLSVVFIAQQAFCGGITIENNMPSVLDKQGREKNVVTVYLNLNWTSAEQVQALLETTFADAATFGGGSAIALAAKGKTLPELVYQKYDASVLPIKMTIYPGKSESFNQLGVWLTDFKFESRFGDKLVVKGLYNTEYTGNWNKIHVPAHQYWNLSVHAPAA